MENLLPIERKPAQAPIAPRGTLSGTEYPAAPDKVAEECSVLLMVDHASVSERPDPRAAGWIKAMLADGAKL